jgi:hypothetical protein
MLHIHNRHITGQSVDATVADSLDDGSIFARRLCLFAGIHGRPSITVFGALRQIGTYSNGYRFRSVICDFSNAVAAWITLGTAILRTRPREPRDMAKIEAADLPGRRIQRALDGRARCRLSQVLRDHRPVYPAAAAGLTHRYAECRRVRIRSITLPKSRATCTPCRPAQSVGSSRAPRARRAVHHRSRIASNPPSSAKRRHTTPRNTCRVRITDAGVPLAALEKIGSTTVAPCEAIMRSKPHPERGARSCGPASTGFRGSVFYAVVSVHG